MQLHMRASPTETIDCMSMEQGDADDEDTFVFQLPEVPRLNPERLRPHLLLIKGPNVGQLFPVHEGATILGRGDDVGMHVADSRISRAHARIECRSGVVTLFDLRSANGTYVNGELVTQRELRDGDKINLGPRTVLRLNYQDAMDEAYQRQLTDALSRDSHTGAFNKAYFFNRMASDLALAKRHATPLSAMLFDIDFFKKVNDTHGHLAGDAVLARLGQLAAASLRPEDVFARYGGEEFAVLFRGTKADTARLLADRLRAVIASHPFEHDGQRLQVTVSAGVATYPDLDCHSAQELLAAADTALYEAKRGGRNCVRVYRPPPVAQSQV